MKWVAFAAALLAVAPFALWLRGHRQHWTIVWSVVGFLPYYLPPFMKIGLFTWPWFPGYAHGLEITLLDLMIVGLALTLPPSRRSVPLRFVRMLYLIAMAISIAQAEYAAAAFFALWQLLRMYLVFAVVVRASADTRVPWAILRGMAYGVVFTGVLALIQRYFLGYHEVLATWDHQNGIGMSCGFGALPALGMLLAGRKEWLVAAAPLAGALAVLLSLSRGGFLMLVGGMGFVVLFSMRWLNPRRILVAAAMTLVVGLLVAKAFDQLQVRFTERSYGAFDDEVLDERAGLELAASLMLRENPLGVGANHFTQALHGGGYFERAHLSARATGTERIKVHNLYWMTAVELGYAGVAAYGLLVLSVLARTFRGAWRERGGVRGDVLFGLGAAILTFHVHGLVEFAQVMMRQQYLFWLSAGVAVALSQVPPARGGSRSTARKDRRLPAPVPSEQGDGSDGPC